MREHLEQRAAELVAARVPFVQATVVRAQHPTSAHAGDEALVLEDGRLEGFVGGVCAESSVVVHGLRALEMGQPLLLRVLAGAGETIVEEGAVTVSNPCLSGGALEIFLDPRTPPPRVVVIGDTPIAHALRTLGEPLGFAIELTTDGESLPDGTDMALVVASHGRDEEAALEAALHAGVPYVGLVASRARGAAVLATLDVTDELRKQVSTPAGLDIGARTAPEIALSILAEIIAVRATERPTPEVTASAVDPVCGMTVPVVPSTLSLEHEGRTVHFCSEHCRDAFAG